MQLYLALRFITILISSWYLFVTANQCEPFEENQSYQFLFRWNPSLHVVSTVTLDRDGILLATCYADMKCDNYFDHVSDTKITASVEGTLLINYTIFSATRRNAGVWTLKQVQGAQHHTTVVRSCSLKSYSKVDTITCENHLAGGGVDIVCEVQKIYPPAVCQFDVQHNKAEFKGHKKLEYNHKETFDDERNVFYKTLCRFHISKNVLPNREFSVEVSAYPNVTGDIRDARYETKASVQFDIDESESLVLTACNEDTAQDTDKICVMKSREPSAPEETPTNKTLETVGVVSDVESKSSISGKCEVATHDNDIDVICKFVHIYPNGIQCKLNLRPAYGGHLIIDGRIETSELTSNAMSAYLSECLFVVSGNFISPGQYKAFVIANNEDGNRKSDNLTFYFELEVQSPVIANNESAFSQVPSGAIYIIISVLILLMGLILISVFAVRFKILPWCRNSVKEEDHRYEEIDITGIQTDDTESQRLYKTKIENKDNLTGILDYIMTEQRREMEP